MNQMNPQENEVKAATDTLSVDDAKKFAIAAHLSPLIGALIPFSNAIGPFALWYNFKDKNAMIAEHAKSAFNFHATVTAVMLGFVILTAILTQVAISVGFGLGLLGTLFSSAVLLPLIGLGCTALMIMGAIKANEGKSFTYPMSYKFIK